jgi:YHS domain-containing protein
MTSERQEANGIATKPHFGPGMALIALALLAGLGETVALESIALAATTERVVTNRYSGLAIEGYDPLAYFVDGQPALGLPDFEAAQGGAVWRFRNEGNRASFVAHPEIYGPQFGGYDPVDLARGITVAGNPLFWTVAGERLYLFGREDNRDAFAANPASYLNEARKRWPALEEQLAQ